MKYLKLAAILMLPLVATACNTISGAGEDLQKGGQKIEQKADENKKY